MLYVCIIIPYDCDLFPRSDGLLLITRMHPREPATTARRPLRIRVISEEGGGTTGAFDSEVQ